MLRRGRLKKFFWKEDHSFGYIQCAEEEDDIYFYAVELVNDIGLVGSWNKKFEQLHDLVGAHAFVEVSVVQTSRGVKAVRPMRLLPDEFEGKEELVAQLDEQLLARSQAHLGARRAEADEEEGEEEEQEECEEEEGFDAWDPEIHDWPTPEGAYVRELQNEISRLLRERASMKKPARDVSLTNVQAFVRWLSWQDWDPSRAWKGLSSGTWPEKAKDHFGETRQVFLGKAKAFVQGTPDVDMNKGILTKDFFCDWCKKPRIVGKDYYEDQLWYCKSCFLSWRGIGPRGMSDRGRLNKSKKGKGGQAKKKGKKAKAR
ncbi:adck1 [Symbiodinium sp. CCMP2592]|nr:adck1 [Symbiodinium sp. CCMP2592]